MIALLIVGCSQSSESYTDINENSYRLSNTELESLFGGEIILRRGHGRLSDMISTFLQEQNGVTHSGIIVKRNDSLFVIHSLSSSVSDIDGIQLQPLDEFVARSKDSTLIITRLQSDSDTVLAQIQKDAFYYLGQEIAFDHSFDCYDRDEFTCSELIWQILEQNDYIDIPDAEEQRKAYNSLNYFYNDSVFDIVLAH
ncbi:MAG: YiiX/YebB-like N1pC/P60 family cysteine hydrolase [Chitinophagales bacterium]